MRLLLLVFCAALALCSSASAQGRLPQVLDRFIHVSGDSSPISPANPAVVSGAAVVTQAIRVADSQVQSVAMSVHTTQTIAGSVQIQTLVTDPDGTEAWVAYDPAVTRSFTGVYEKAWALHLPVSAVIRFRFVHDASYPYEVRRLVLRRQ
jgi:hypothetical protein